MRVVPGTGILDLRLEIYFVDVFRKNETRGADPVRKPHPVSLSLTALITWLCARVSDRKRLHVRAEVPLFPAARGGGARARLPPLEPRLRPARRLQLGAHSGGALSGRE